MEKAIGPNSPITLKLVSAISAVGMIAVMIWQAAVFKTEVTSELRNAVIAIEAMRQTLEKSGNDVQQLASRVSSLELMGSAPLRGSVEKLEKAQAELFKQVDGIDRRMQVHLLRTEDGVSFPSSTGTKKDADRW